ncbi:MAG: O-antigen ligase family protein [Clostridiales Family XIII bacterium]|nr:O-antigen ligase family protein [Clostridiales Family XIII bacterium]
MKKPKRPDRRDPCYAWSMSRAGESNESVSVLQILPAMVFTAVVIMLVRYYYYERDMSRFFWSVGVTEQREFFSHAKVVLILICVLLALLVLLFRFCMQSMAVKRSVLYYPMIVYAIMVLLSYFASSEKEYAWHGWNERFEGTYILLCYMVMLFYIVNSVNSERNVKQIVYPLGVTSGLLALLGLSQYIDRDFLRTQLGQKLIVPNEPIENSDLTTWGLIDQLAEEGRMVHEFAFKQGEIYQTVYNINYVSFYLTLLIPLFGMIFIRERDMRKKIVWGVLFTLLITNLIGSASSGGFLGMFFVVLAAVVVLNKRILQWWRSVAVLLAVTIIVAGVTYERWYPELSSAVRGVLNITETESVAASAGVADAEPGEAGADAALADGTSATVAPAAEKAVIDYFVNEGADIVVSVNGNEAILTTDKDDPFNISVKDADGKELPVKDDLIQFGGSADATNPALLIDDPRFAALTIVPASAESEVTGEITYYCMIGLAGDPQIWPFALTDEGTFYHNEIGKRVKLRNVPHIGWSDNSSFGSGRGYIWSRTLPMLRDTLILGRGADTYCVYFPHEDYVGKYNAGWNINMIVDKPHNMYLGAAVGTGMISVLALLALFLLYIVQSFRLYLRARYDDFVSSAGAGIFFGVLGFLVSAFVDDSSVSVMPLFYGLLGVGIAINILLSAQTSRAA